MALSLSKTSSFKRTVSFGAPKMQKDVAYLELVDEDGDGVEVIAGVGRVSHGGRGLSSGSACGRNPSCVSAREHSATWRTGEGGNDVSDLVCGRWRVVVRAVMQ